METIDRAEEWRRLKELYLRMSDEELEAVASDDHELTDVAHQALQGENSRRGLKFELRKTAAQMPEAQGDSTPDPATLDLTSIWQVWDRSEATKARDILRDNGLPSFFGPNSAEALEDVAGSFDRGVDIKVRYVDSDRARALLAQALPQEATEQATPDYVARCPKCHSDQIVFVSLEENSAETAGTEFNWSCDACGYQWKDDGVEERP